MVMSRGLGDVYKRQHKHTHVNTLQRRRRSQATNHAARFLAFIACWLQLFRSLDIASSRNFPSRDHQPLGFAGVELEHKPGRKDVRSRAVLRVLREQRERDGSRRLERWAVIAREHRKVTQSVRLLSGRFGSASVRAPVLMMSSLSPVYSVTP